MEEVVIELLCLAYLGEKGVEQYFKFDCDFKF